MRPYSSGTQRYSVDGEGDPFQYLSFGGTFNRTLNLFMERFDLFLTLSGIVLVPFCILMATTTVTLVALTVEKEHSLEDFHPKHMPLIASIIVIQFLFYALVTVVGRAAMIRAVSLMYLGEPNEQIQWYPCLRQSLGQFWSLVGAQLILAGGFGVTSILPWAFIIWATVKPGFLSILLATIFGVLFVAAAIYMYISLVLSTPAIVIEKRTSIQGLQRAWELSQGSRCYILCTLFVFWFVNNLISRLLHNMFTSGTTMDLLFSVAGIVVSILPLLVFTPLHTM